MNGDFTITTSRWPSSIVEVASDIITDAPRPWRAFIGERFTKLTAWLEKIGAGPVKVSESQTPRKDETDAIEDTDYDSRNSLDEFDGVAVRGSRGDGAAAAHTSTAIAFEPALACGAIIGPSGSGKSYTLRERIKEDPKYAILAATTGIAAVNLGEGVTTIHSLLGFYDLQSAIRAHEKGSIAKRFVDLARKGYKNVVIDEMSMLPGELLEIIHQAAWQAAQRIATGEVYRKVEDGDGGTRREAVTQSCGVLLTGDFCQLPPVQGKFAFQAPCWSEYGANLERLTKIWRQDNPLFLIALRHLRQGSGAVAGMKLKEAGVTFSPVMDNDFDGVTLFATNKSVDKFNRERLAKLPGDSSIMPSAKLGRKSAEWDAIPEELIIKKDALVMILVNDHDAGFVNGDLAYVQSTARQIAETGCVMVRLRRNGEVKVIDYALRSNLSYDESDSLADQFAQQYPELNARLKSYDLDDKKTYAMYKEYLAGVEIGEPFKPYWEPVKGGTVVGVVEYMPLRIAYASTTHKAQGLTLDSVQIDANNKWSGNAGMMYVAVSRARRPEGIRIVVSDMGRFGRRVKTAPEVKEWI